MKFEYIKPELEIELFEVEDVITLSIVNDDEEQILFGDITWEN